MSRDYLVDGTVHGSAQHSRTSHQTVRDNVNIMYKLVGANRVNCSRESMTTVKTQPTI